MNETKSPGFDVDCAPSIAPEAYVVLVESVPLMGQDFSHQSAFLILNIALGDSICETFCIVNDSYGFLSYIVLTIDMFNIFLYLALTRATIPAKLVM